MQAKQPSIAASAGPEKRRMTEYSLQADVAIQLPSLPAGGSWPVRAKDVAGSFDQQTPRLQQVLPKEAKVSLPLGRG